MRNDIPKDKGTGAVHGDAKGQFAKSEGDREASGVHSAKPTVITGSEDATAHKVPPGKHVDKAWSENRED
ncbi:MULTISPECIES: hypothetical protein [unclassified Rhizobium]|jgi:hypothetical protein|uniref:hypothetical protein n=1 Tax=unclassified Rhizobium TaxID=2613769 RepID=UPI003D27EC1B